jgi:hypothetical protein
VDREKFRDTTSPAGFSGIILSMNSPVQRNYFTGIPEFLRYFPINRFYYPGYVLYAEEQ